MAHETKVVNARQILIYKTGYIKYDTTGKAITALLDYAASWDGYLEKKNNGYLADFTKNAGSGNYTIFGSTMHEVAGFGVNNAWCDCFVDCCFTIVFGVEGARKLLGGFSAYTPTSASYYKQMGRFYSSPQVGDQIFFKNSQRICHTGLVYKVTDSAVYTIEGNTSSAAGMEANGGCVRKKSYKRSYGAIAGYGRPNYSVVAESTNVTNINKKTYPRNNDIKTLQSALNEDYKARLAVDGEWGPLTEKAVKKVAIKNYDGKHRATIKFIQNKVGTKVDGIFGKNTEAAVRRYQKARGLVVDGIVGIRTLKAMCNV